jgi:uncharacterized protein (DUF2141 family)
MAAFLRYAAPGAFLFGATAQAADLKVVIDGVANSSGTIVVGLYDNAANYASAVEESSKVLVNDSRRLVGVSLRAVAGRQSVVFTDLKPGTYAVIVFHDENDDGKLDKNALGLPTEAYVISNNVRGLLAPPEFKDAAVALGESDRVIEMRLIYPRGLGERP